MVHKRVMLALKYLGVVFAAVFIARSCARVTTPRKAGRTTHHDRDDFFSTRTDAFTDGCLLESHTTPQDQTPLQSLDTSSAQARACVPPVNASLLSFIQSSMGGESMRSVSQTTMWRRATGLNFDTVASAITGRQPNILVLLIDSLSRQQMNAYLPRVRAELQGLMQNKDARRRKPPHIFPFSRAVTVGPSTAAQVTALMSGLPLKTPRAKLEHAWLTAVLGTSPHASGAATSAPRRHTWHQPYKAAYIYCCPYLVNENWWKRYKTDMVDAYMDDADVLWGDRCVHDTVVHTGVLNRLQSHGVDDHGDHVCPHPGSRHTEVARLASQLASFWARHDAATPKFAVLHSLAAHFPYNPKTVSLHEDVLLAIIRAVVHADDTVLLLMSDHGDQREPDSHALPYANFIVPSWVLTSGQAAAMRANTQSIVSVYDFHATLRAFGGCPPSDGVSLASSSKAGAEAEHGSSADSTSSAKDSSPPPVCGRTPVRPQILRTTVDDLTNQRPGHVLFGTVLPKHRTCADVGSPRLVCPCTSWRRVNDGGAREAHELFLSLVAAKHKAPCPSLDMANITDMETSTDGDWRVKVTSNYGRRFELVLRASIDAATPRLDVYSLKQLTPYMPDHACTPNGTDAQFCPCSKEAVHAFEHQFAGR